MAERREACGPGAARARTPTLHTHVRTFKVQRRPSRDHARTAQRGRLTYLAFLSSCSSRALSLLSLSRSSRV